MAAMAGRVARGIIKLYTSPLAVFQQKFPACGRKDIKER
jgi:hypothetical protein